MSKPFDATTKQLVETRPADWIALAGVSVTDSVEMIDTDLSTVTTATDRVIRVNAPAPWLAHLELQSGPSATLLARTFQANALLTVKFNLTVLSVIVLLHDRANSPTYNGIFRRALPDGTLVHEFRYRVVRVWELPAEALLTGGLGTLPLAPLAAVAPDDLPGVVRRMKARLDAETDAAQARQLWTATYVLMGLRYERAFTDQLLREVQGMKESVTYQAIIREGMAEGRAKGLEEGREEGRAQEARAVLLRLGGKRFGTPDAPTNARVEAVASVERLETLIVRVLEVESWDELLADA